MQVIGREAADDRNNQKNAILKKQELDQDYQYKVGMLKYYESMAKSNAKMTDSEVEAKQWETKAAQANLFSGLLTTAASLFKDPEQRLKYVTTMVNNYAPKMQDLLQDQQWRDMIKNTQTSGEEEQKRAVAGRERAVTGLINQQIGNIGGDQQQLQQPQQQGPMQAAPQAMDQSSRSAAVGGNAPQNRGGAVVSGMNVGGIDIAFPEVQADLEGKKVMARKEAELAVELKPLETQVGYFLGVFDAAVKEMGGSPDNALLAHLKGRGAILMGELGKRPNTQALGRIGKSVVLSLASYANRGRPSDKDAEAMAGTMLQLYYAGGTNEVIRNYLQTIVGGKDMMPMQDGSNFSPSARSLYDKLKELKKTADPASKFDASNEFIIRRAP